MRHFIFLEFLDPRVQSTLRELKDALRPELGSKSPVHVTLRGPYTTQPDSDFLVELSERLKGRGVRIIGAGMFKNPKGYAVFLRAESSAFRELWWKPDFQTPLADIQPHLTLYESTDKSTALLALNFLRAARISILTYSVQLSVYTPGQPDLFGTRLVGIAPPNQSVRRDIVAIDPEVLPAAKDLGTRLAEMESAHEDGEKSGDAT